MRDLIKITEGAGNKQPLVLPFDPINPPRPPGYADRLADRHEIAAYIGSLSSSYVDEEFIEEHYFGCAAHLMLVPINEITEGNAAANIRSARKEGRYRRLDPATMPPLVIDEHNAVDDGNHRLRVAKAMGFRALWCYKITDN